MKISNLATVSGGSLMGSFYAIGGTPEQFEKAVAAGDFGLTKEVTDFPNLVHLIFPARVPGTDIRFLWFDTFYRSDVQSRLLDRTLLRGKTMADLNCNNCPKLMMLATDLDSGDILGLTPNNVVTLKLPNPSQKHDLLFVPSASIADLQGLPLAAVNASVTEIASDSFPANSSISEIVTASGAFPFAFNSIAKEIHQINRKDPVHVDLADGGIRDNSGVLMFRAASYKLPDWNADLLIASDASAIIAALPVGDNGETGLTRALDLMYSNNGLEGVHPPKGSEPSLGDVPDVIWISPENPFGGGIRRTTLLLARLLWQREWYRPKEGFFELVGGADGSIRNSLRECIAQTNDQGQEVCRWTDEKAKEVVAKCLLTEFQVDLDVFLRTSTLSDHPSAEESRRLFQLGRFLVIMSGRQIDMKLYTKEHSRELMGSSVAGK